MEKKENKLIWKILLILILLFAVVIWFKGESDKREIYEDYSDCTLKKKICIELLNETLEAWYTTFVEFGRICFNVSEEEIQKIIDLPMNDSIENLIKFREDTK